MTERRTDTDRLNDLSALLSRRSPQLGGRRPTDLLLAMYDRADRHGPAERGVCTLCGGPVEEADEQ